MIKMLKKIRSQPKKIKSQRRKKTLKLLKLPPPRALKKRKKKKPLLRTMSYFKWIRILKEKTHPEY